MNIYISSYVIFFFNLFLSILLKSRSSFLKQEKVRIMGSWESVIVFGQKSNLRQVLFIYLFYFYLFKQREYKECRDGGRVLQKEVFVLYFIFYILQIQIQFCLKIIIMMSQALERSSKSQRLWFYIYIYIYQKLPYHPLTK